MNKAEIYDQKVKRVMNTVEHKETDIVPSMAMIGTWAVSHAGITLEDIEKDPQKEIDVYCKPYEELYTDVAYTCGIGFDPMGSKLIGAEGRFISPDGMTIQHHEVVPMNESDYPEFIKDPVSFMMNVIMPRKATKLSGGYQDSYNAINDFINYQGAKKRINTELREKLKTDYSVPVIAGSTVKPAMDIIFDCLRGFSGVSTDMRRRPKEFKAAVLALEEFANLVVGIPENAESLPAFPFYATMMHIPTFISPKQFEEFFWPTYLKTILRIEKLGGKLIMFLEGKWENKYDYLNALPQNFAIGIVEGDDIFDAKKKIGNVMTLAGGMPLQMIKFATESECTDYAKKLIDSCAPGGGYIFTSSRELISANDIKFENLKALHNYVRDFRA